MEYSYFTALLMGLFGAVHCVGMCGSISGVLTFSLPEQKRHSTPYLLAFSSLYSIGRLLSYSLAGALAGLFGNQILGSISPRQGHTVLLLMSTVMMVAIGLYLAGLFPRFAFIERMGVPLWRRLEPLGRKLLPVRTIPQALSYGLVWGWLPCGLVYSALLLALSQGQAIQGALYMFIFGLGTLPAVVATGVFAGSLSRFAQNRKYRVYAGILLILLALIGLGLNWNTNEHIH